MPKRQKHARLEHWPDLHWHEPPPALVQHSESFGPWMQPRFASQVAVERQVSALLPPWAWTLIASALLGAHWIARRRGGLV